MENNQTPMPQYSYTKGIRLKLQHLSGILPTIEEKEPDIQQFLKDGKHLLDILEGFIYYKRDNGKWASNKQGKRFLTSLVNVNKNWLKRYFQQEFYAHKKQLKHTLDNIPYLASAFADWIQTWEQHLDQLNGLINVADHQKSRRADIGFLFQALSREPSFPLIRDFAKGANHKDKENLLPEIIESLETGLQTALEYYLPEQSAGIAIARASLNYYTVNKKPKEYYAGELAKTREQFKQKSQEYIGNKTYKGDQKKYLFEAITQGDINKPEDLEEKQLDLFKGDKECLTEVIRLTQEITKLSADVNQAKQGGKPASKETREALTQIKKERGFYFIKKTRGKKHDNYFKKWWSFCEEYRKTAQSMGKLKAQIKGLEREQAEAAQMRYWAVIASTDNSMEKELWLIPKDNRKKAQRFINNSKDPEGLKVVQFLSLTQRALHKLCFAEESTFVKDMPEDLKKLQEDVKKATNDPDKKKNPSQQLKSELELEFLKQVLESDYGNELLDLADFDFSRVVQAKNLDEFETELESACYVMKKNTMNQQRKSYFLEKFSVLSFKLTSYDIEQRNLDTHQTPASEPRRHMRDIWQKFWQGGKDLRMNPEIIIRYRRKNQQLEKYLQEKGFDLTRTKHRMLQDQYIAHMSFELNAGKKYPQLAFVKPEEIKSKIDAFNNDFNQQNWDNMWRYGIDRGQIELATLCIAKFNPDECYHYNDKTFLQPSFPNAEQDLKAYALKADWYNKKAVSNRETKPREQRKEKRVIANLSYFTDKISDTQWFEEKTCTCIDLTTAKVIHGHIILNGDILTFLKLKKEAAKRILFDLVSDGKITSDTKLEWAINEYDNELRYHKQDKKTTVYHYEGDRGRDFTDLLIKEDVSYTKEGIKQNLQQYLDKVLEEKAKPSADSHKHVPSVNKINHLRDALVANMIGVIFHLQKTYPGIVILEDLDMDTIAVHFQSLNINISRRLELALYRKFQGLGMVPPHIKGITSIREKARDKYYQPALKHAEKEHDKWAQRPKNIEKSDEEKQNQKKLFEDQEKAPYREKYAHQIGAMVYVDEYKTSRKCPYCNQAIRYKNTEIEDELKFKQHRFVCGEKSACDFDTDRFHKEKHEAPPVLETTKDFSAFRELDDPDKVAAYNVARKIREPNAVFKFSDDNKTDVET